MQISHLKHEDLSALAELFTQFWGDASSVPDMEKLLDRLQPNPDYLLLAAKQDGVLAGFCMGIICQSLYGDCRPFLVIEDFVVDRNHRREGIGKALMAAVEQEARSRNCSQAILVTENDRTDAHGFYVAQGFSSGTHRGFKKPLDSQSAETGAP